MNREYNFTIGQRVKVWDEDFETWFLGTVDDKTRDSVFIRWDMGSRPVEYQKHEYGRIRLATDKIN